MDNTMIRELDESCENMQRQIDSLNGQAEFAPPSRRRRLENEADELYATRKESLRRLQALREKASL